MFEIPRRDCLVSGIILFGRFRTKALYRFSFVPRCGGGRRRLRREGIRPRTLLLLLERPLPASLLARLPLAPASTVLGRGRGPKS